MRRPTILILPFLALLATQWWMVDRERSALFAGELFDSDAYMRLVRVQKLIRGDGWYDARIRRSNAPIGETLHWTRPQDGLLLAGAALLAPMLGWPAGLHWTGVWLSPVLHILALALMLWAARPLLPTGGLLWLGLLFPAQLLLDFQFAPGRPDHHALIMLLFIWFLGALIRALADDAGPGRIVPAAIAAALLLWVSVEGLLSAMLLFPPLALAWLVRGGPWALRGLLAAAVMTAGAALAVVLEYPPGAWFTVAHDRISIVHVVLLALLACAFAVAAGSQRRLPGLLGFAAVPAVQALAFPGFFAGPLSAADDTFRAAIFNYAGETAPLTAPADFLAFLGPALIALPVSLWHLRRPGGRPAWAILALGLLLFGPLAVMQMRWTSYVAILALPGYAWLLAGILARLDRRRPLSLLFLSSLGRTVAVLAFAVGFFLASRLVPGQGSQDPKCPLDGMARHLATEGSAEHGRLRILSYLTVASAILYRGPHEVIGTPYFRNREGGRDTLAFFGASDPERAREIVDRRRVDLVLACPADRESRLYRGDGAKPTLLDRLAAGTAPAWLRPIPLPADLAAWYRLYEVRR